MLKWCLNVNEYPKVPESSLVKMSEIDLDLIRLKLIHYNFLSTLATFRFKLNYIWLMPVYISLCPPPFFGIFLLLKLLINPK